jgi:hypothetical protein
MRWPYRWVMHRIGLHPDELAATWVPRRYACRIAGLDVLEGETIALVGEGTDEVLTELAAALPHATWVDGQIAAEGGALRIHAQQAARVGVRALTVTGPFDARLDEAGRALAVADLAGLGELGLTTIVEVADADLAALFADRVVVVAQGRPVVAYPVIAPTPRVLADVRPVTERLAARLAAVL